MPVIPTLISWFTTKRMSQIDLFKTGGGEKAADNLKVPFLGRIPLEPEIVQMGDSGKPFVNFSKEIISSKIMKEIIDKSTAYVKTNDRSQKNM